MHRRDRADQLHDDDRFPDAGASENTRLASLGERCDQINHLESGFEHIDARRLFIERRGVAVDRIAHFRYDCIFIINGTSQDVENPAQRLLAIVAAPPPGGAARV